MLFGFRPSDFLRLSVFGFRPSLHPRQPLTPDMVQQHGSFHVAQAILRDLPIPAFRHESIHIRPGHTLGLGRLNAECLAVEVQVEPARRPIPAADAVERELFHQIAVRLGLEAIAQPVLARDRHVEQRRTEVNERHVEPAPVERDARLIMLRHIPKRRQQLALIHARHELYRASLVRSLLVVRRREKHLAARGVRIEHGNANHLRRQGPQIELPLDFGMADVARPRICHLFALAKQVFLLRFVELLERQRRGLDVEYQLGHYAPNLSNILALACIRRMRYFASKTPSEPELAPVSVNRASLSEPEQADCSITGSGCHECPFMAQGVEWSPVMASTSGFLRSRMGSAASNSSIAFFFAAKLPSSPYMSVYLK